MYLIQILLPIFNNSGRKFPAEYFQTIKNQLTARFKGLTAYNRKPAEGRWKKRRTVQREEIIVYEVMAARLEMKWWRQFKLTLEKQFHQDAVVIRVQKISIV